MNRLRELREELGSVLAGRKVRVLDVVLPTAVFLVLNATTGLKPAAATSVVLSVLILIYRLVRRQPPSYALGGLAGALLSAVFALLGNSAAEFFLPGLISNGLTVVLLLGSLILQRPLAALSSHLTRGWPISWYWHPRILPAYREVTLFWVVGFGARAGVAYWLYLQDAAGSLGLVQTVMGWPYTILLLVISYLYGLWRLGTLGGPSVAEFEAEKEPPWMGQIRGF